MINSVRVVGYGFRQVRVGNGLSWKVFGPHRIRNVLWVDKKTHLFEACSEKVKHKKCKSL